MIALTKFKTRERLKVEFVLNHEEKKKNQIFSSVFALPHHLIDPRVLGTKINLLNHIASRFRERLIVKDPS